MRKWVAVFPGQGSQRVGMLSGYAAEAEWQTAYRVASQTVGLDLAETVTSGPQESLDQTAYTQPALLTASWVLYRLWIARQDFSPSFLLGHSLGEYTAWLIAGSFSFSDAVALVHARGRYMQEAPAGAMAAVLGWEVQQVARVCAACDPAHGRVVPANLNGPDQTVISGDRKAVDAVLAAMRAEPHPPKKCLVLPVSVAAHSPLMEKAAVQLGETLNSIRIASPRIPVLTNSAVDTPTHPDDIRAALVRQMVSPVRWTETIVKVAESGLHRYVELGPGKILSGLNRRIDLEALCWQTDTPERLWDAMQAV